MHSLLCALNLNSTIELLDRVRVALLVQQKLSAGVYCQAQCRCTDDVDVLVVLGLAAIGECLECAPERRHAVRKVPGLVLGNSELDVAEHELVVEFGRLGVVFCRIRKLVHDEQDCVHDDEDIPR